MSASLVGSEMCIRDRRRAVRRVASSDEEHRHLAARNRNRRSGSAAPCSVCLLYTSDAADDM
eukprot:7520010-Alexandrium_andersonii.AAC.1